MKRLRYVVGHPAAASAEKVERVTAEFAAFLKADPCDVLVVSAPSLAISAFEVDGLDPLPKPVKEEVKADVHATAAHATKSKGKE